MAAGIAWSDALLTSIPHQSPTLRTFFGFAREIVGVQPTKKNSVRRLRLVQLSPKGSRKTRKPVGRRLSPAVRPSPC